MQTLTAVKGMVEGNGRSNVVALFLLALARGAGVGAYMLLYSIYLSTLGYSMSGIGLTITIASLVAAATGPAFGALLDSLGSRIAVAVTSSLPGLALLLLSFPSYPLILSSYIASMMAFSYGQPARMTLLYRSVSIESLAWYASLLTLAFGISRATGSYVAGLLAPLIGFKWTFTLLALVVFIGVAVFLGIAVGDEPSGGEDIVKAVKEAYQRALKPDRGLLTLYALVAVDRVSWSLWLPMASAILYRMGFSVEEVALAYTIQSVAQTIVTPLAGIVADRTDPRLVLLASEAFGVLGVTLLALGYPVESFTVIGASIAAWVPSYNKLVGLLAKGRPGEAYSTANSVRMAAGSLTPYLGGAIYDLAGLQTLLLASATGMVAASALALTIPLAVGVRRA